jgi:hypothetical protein
MRNFANLAIYFAYLAICASTDKAFFRALSVSSLRAMAKDGPASLPAPTDGIVLFS